MGVASPLGRLASLRRTGTLIYSLGLCDRVCQFRLAGCHLYRHRLRTGWGPQAGIPRGRYLAEAPLVVQATVRNFGSDFVILSQTRIMVQRSQRLDRP